jgi:toxin FitB
VTYLFDANALTLGEIEQGIARVRGRGDPQQASARERWLRDVETRFEDRVLPVIDALIAATARAHGMTVVTRNAVASSCQHGPGCALPGW